MNVIQRLFSNTVMAFAGSALMKVSTSVLFIFIGRMLGPSDAGVFTLGVTYYAIIVALSTFGLHELLVREVAPRRDESGRYLVNYLLIRLVVTAILYAGLLLFLELDLPYSEEAKTVVRIMALGVFPEAIFSLCQALFAAHEMIFVPTIGAFINSAVTLIFGGWLLENQGTVTSVAWFMPVANMAGLIIFPFALVWLFRKVPQAVMPGASWSFMRTQLAFTPGFILLGLFATLNFQADTFIISFLLPESDLGYFGAAQTLVAGFLLIPAAIRVALYPLMALYKQQDEERLYQVYRKSGQYLLMLGLPMAVGVTLLAEPIIVFFYGVEFLPAVPVLQLMIWAVVVVVLTVPVARMMLVHGQQSRAGWMRGIGMVASVALNLLLIPIFGIVGAGLARVLASLLYFFFIYWIVQTRILKGGGLRVHPGVILATIVMAVAVWLLRDLPLLIPVVAGVVVYATANILLGVFTVEDRYYLRQLFQARKS
jgi:O-antigen/teichoic acid export membrane protein